MLGGIIAAQNRDLLNGVDSEIVAKDAAGSTVGIIVDADSVQAIAVLVGSGAGDAYWRPKAAFGISTAAGASRLNAGDARLQSGNLGPIASVERRILHDGIVNVTGRLICGPTRHNSAHYSPGTSCGHQNIECPPPSH